MLFLELSYTLRQLSSPTRYFITLLSLTLTCWWWWRYPYRALHSSSKPQTPHFISTISTQKDNQCLDAIASIFMRHGATYSLEQNSSECLLKMQCTVPYKVLVQQAQRANLHPHTIRSCTLERTTNGYVACLFNIQNQESIS